MKIYRKRDLSLAARCACHVIWISFLTVIVTLFHLTVIMTLFHRKHINGLLQRVAKKKSTDDGADRKKRIVEKLLYRADDTVMVRIIYWIINTLFNSTGISDSDLLPSCSASAEGLCAAVPNSWASCSQASRQNGGFVTGISGVFHQGRESRRSGGEEVEKLQCQRWKGQTANRCLMHTHLISSSSISQVHMRQRYMYMGAANRTKIAELGMKDSRTRRFLSKIEEAYTSCAAYLLRKLPLNNKNLMALSALDPVSRSHSLTATHLKSLVDIIPAGWVTIAL